MILLSRFLDLRELGFCSALLSSYGLFEQITDMAFYRFVIATPKEEFEEALASVHALSLLRGILVGLCAVAFAPVIAGAFDLSQDRLAFVSLGAIIFVRSFENFAPRVAERDFHFSAQFKIVLTANVLSLLTLAAGVAVFDDHRALLASLFVFMAVYAAASHFWAETRYRIRFRSPLFARAFQFGYPLTVNGAGLALSSQADRFLVGSMLGLPALGVYTVISTAVVLPTNLVWRVMGGVTTSLLFRATSSGRDKLRLIGQAGSVSAIVAAAAAICVSLLLNDAVMLIFGDRFHVSGLAVILLAFVAYFRIARGEPFNSILLLERRTKRLALTNFAVALGLIFSYFMMAYSHSLKSAFAARLLGEALGLAAALYLTRNLVGDASWRLGLSCFIGLAFASASALLAWLGWANAFLPARFAALAVFGAALLAWGALSLGPEFKRRLSIASEI